MSEIFAKQNISENRKIVPYLHLVDTHIGLGDNFDILPLDTITINFSIDKLYENKNAIIFGCSQFGYDFIRKLENNTIHNTQEVVKCEQPIEIKVTAFKENSMFINNLNSSKNTWIFNKQVSEKFNFAFGAYHEYNYEVAQFAGKFYSLTVERKEKIVYDIRPTIIDGKPTAINMISSEIYKTVGKTCEYGEEMQLK